MRKVFDVDQRRPLRSRGWEYEPRLCDGGRGFLLLGPLGVRGPLSLTLPLSKEITWPYNRPFPFHRLVLRCAQRNFPFIAGVVVINSDGVGNLKVAVDCAIEAGCIAGMAKLRRWGFADWASEGHGYA
jgi:hypothetical protein